MAQALAGQVPHSPIILEQPMMMTPSSMLTPFLSQFFNLLLYGVFFHVLDYFTGQKSGLCNDTETALAKQLKSKSRRPWQAVTRSLTKAVHPTFPQKQSLAILAGCLSSHTFAQLKCVCLVVSAFLLESSLPTTTKFFFNPKQSLMPTICRSHLLIVQ
jgi:hypothetical protein